MFVLKIEVVSVEKLQLNKKLFSSGCYVSVLWLGKKLKTRVVKDLENLRWDQELEFAFNAEEKQGTILFLLKRSSIFPLSKKKKVVCWCELSSTLIESFAEEKQEFHLKWVDNYNKSTFGILNVNCQIVEVKDLIGGISSKDQPNEKKTGYFLLDVYRAECLPQSDYGVFANCRSPFRSSSDDFKSHLIDPYLVVTFDNEQVRTKTIPHNSNPEWMQRLVLPFVLPLNDWKLCLELKDKDFISKDDLVATVFLPLSKLTAGGQPGVFPCFGPSYINFYGSQRYFNLFEGNRTLAMNSGQVSGCAFRGRVFLRLTTNLGEPVATDDDDTIPVVAVQESKVFSEQEKYVLRVVFMDCYLLRDDDPKCIEISIGGFGDSAVVLKAYSRPSCVLPFHPSSRSEKSFFAPWFGDKPCVLFDVLFEKFAFGVRVLNLLRHLSDLLRRMLSLECDKICDIEVVINVLPLFIGSCQRVKDVKITEDDHITELDNNLLKLAEDCLKQIVNEAEHLMLALQNVSNPSDLDEVESKAFDAINIWIRKLNEIDDLILIGFPDLFFWLCNCSSDTKLGFFRISAADVWFSNISEFSGSLCNKIITRVFENPYDSVVEDLRSSGEVRLNIWFGPQVDFQSSLVTDNDVAAFEIYAETYENMINCCGKLKPKCGPGRWVDVLGKKGVGKFDIDYGNGWKADGLWFVCSENSNLDTIEDNEVEFSVEPGNRSTEEEISLQQMEVSSSEVAPVSLVPAEKDNFVNRRKWRRKMIWSNELTAPQFKQLKVDKNSNKPFRYSSPSMYLVFKAPTKTVLKVYIYQAKNLLAGDKSGFSDPFVRVTFLSYGASGHRVLESLCPLWDEMITINDVAIFGCSATTKATEPQRSSDLLEGVPNVVAEVYDYDSEHDEEFLGHARFQPRFHTIGSVPQPILFWQTLRIGEEVAGELLIGAELFLTNDEEATESSVSEDEYVSIPKQIKPQLQKRALEIFCLGLRNFDESSLDISRPFIEFLCFDVTPLAATNVLEDFPATSNFELVQNNFYVKMLLPAEDLFLPSITIRLKEVGTFSETKIIGGTTVDLFNLFSATSLMFTPLNVSKKQNKDGNDTRRMDSVSSKSSIKERKIESKNKIQKSADDDETLDWWSRYYASKKEVSKCGEFLNKGYGTMMIYDGHLEEMDSLLKQCLNITQNVVIQSGKRVSKYGQLRSQEKITELKVAIGLHRLENDDEDEKTFSKQTSTLFYEMARMCSQISQVLVRVYLIRAHNLKAKDIRNTADPYVRIVIGDVEAEVLETLHNNNLNPIFGRMYETVICWPKVTHLLVKVMDKDLITEDDLIGQTEVNLEGRLISPCHATCGVSSQYFLCGPYSWRDFKTPTEILDAVCQLRGISKPVYHGGRSVSIGGMDLRLKHFEKDVPSSVIVCSGSDQERLALYALHHLSLVVDEHVETRSLYKPGHPGEEQGKLEMWIDMFPFAVNTICPAPIDISPRMPKKFVLRCIVYNVYDVILQEQNILGDEMSDVYIEGWLSGMKDGSQKTDVHYRCLNGEANFNWRLVFPFQFVKGENVLVTQVRERLLDLYPTESSFRPVLCLRLYDYDVFSRDDSLGILELPLLEMKPPVARLKDCNFKTFKRRDAEKGHEINLFKQKCVRGFWICPTDTENIAIAGKMELEIELLTEEEAEARPAGRGREEPNQNPTLEKPSRPSSSFNWLTSPLKSLKNLVFVQFMWPFLLIILVIFLFLFVWFVGKEFLVSFIELNLSSSV